MYEVLKERWEKGTITDTMLKVYVRKGVITEQQYKEITMANDSSK